ncbi:hypothetical protein, partial [Escherichia coli]|uniref:hypothetical protein n=1 Tax=Escherichia coli TaxID=562 RepID=UPI00227FF244
DVRSGDGGYCLSARGWDRVGCCFSPRFLTKSQKSFSLPPAYLWCDQCHTFGILTFPRFGSG